MANLVTGVIGSVIPKLSELLKDEYGLQTGMKERISCLTLELEFAQATLEKVAQVPWYQLDKQVHIWARHVREASYDMEDILDIFLVRVRGPNSTEPRGLLKRLGEKITTLFTKSRARREISVSTMYVMSHLEEVTERRRRYMVNDIAVPDAESSTIDPRLHAMYNKVEDLVGIDTSSSELISILQSPQRVGASNLMTKIVAIAGVGGLGKTTLAKAVYDKLKGDFLCTAFVTVGRKPKLCQVIQGILIELDRRYYMEDFNFAAWHQINQFIDELRRFLHERRYFIVIDDLWEEESWDTIRLGFDDNNLGSRVIITTRNREIIEDGNEVYDLPPLPYASSRKLFYTRIYGDDERNYVDNTSDEICDALLRKCAGIPLAIITMASLLVDKPRERWIELYKSIGFGSESQNTMKIVSFSYYDLPAHLRTCLLYLSAFPEDSVISKDSLVWKWVAEGFVVPDQLGTRLFEIGEGYFINLINRSMIQAVESIHHGNIIIGCRVHDMVLDFICSVSREENFFTVLENDRSTLVNNNNAPRRLAYHGKSMPDHFDMAEKARSFIALEGTIGTCVALSSFVHLRVLAMDKCKQMDREQISIEPLGNLLQLRFLSLRETSINRIPQEIGALRFLQTLDLWLSKISEFPSSSCFPKQLLCLRIHLNGNAPNPDVFCVESMTSLEELSIVVYPRRNNRWLVKGLGSLKELRVINRTDIFWDVESERNFVESLRHLHNLQHLEFRSYDNTAYTPKWQATEPNILPRRLRHFAPNVMFSQLPPCINLSSLPMLSHLDLYLLQVDDQDLKTLGRLPELHFLQMKLWSSSAATISNVSDSESGYFYFPKLRFLQLRYSMVLFNASQEDNTKLSFSIWNRIPVSSMHPVLQRRPFHPSNLQHLAGATPLFMPKLQVLKFYVPEVAVTMGPHYYDDIGLQYLSSLRKITVTIDRSARDEENRERVEASMRRQAQEHRNHPAFGFWPDL